MHSAAHARCTASSGAARRQQGAGAAHVQHDEGEDGAQINRAAQGRDEPAEEV